MPSRVATRGPDNPAALAVYREAPLRYLRSVYLSFLQQLFWYRPPGDLHWSNTEEETEIVISSDYAIDAARANTRPGITITRAPVMFNSICLDDLLRLDQATGTKVKVVQWSGNISINCCSSVATESEELATFVAEHLWLLRHLIMRQGLFNAGQGIIIGATSPAGALVQNDGGKEWYATAVSSSYQMPRQGAVTPLGHAIFREFEIHVGGAGFVPPPEQNLPPLASYPSASTWVPWDSPGVGVEVEQQVGVPQQAPVVGESSTRGLPAYTVKV